MNIAETEFKIFVNIENQESSFIKEIIYDKDEKMVSVIFRPDLPPISIRGFTSDMLDDWLQAPSIGKYYNSYIKQLLTTKKTKMANKVNKHSSQKRFIKMSICLTDIDRDFILVHEKNGKKYLPITLRLLPDGTVDKYGNLGMITQDVPKEVKEKNPEYKSPILGNGCEFERAAPAGTPGSTEGMTYAGKSEQQSDDFNDDLPF